jgi:hypothetical protein
MMSSHPLRPVFAVSLLVAAALACNFAAAPAVEPTTAAEPSQTEPPAATNAAPTEVVATPEPTATVPVVHTLFPGEPPSVERFMTDRSSAALAGEHRSIGDDFTNGRFERPFTTQAMEYKPYLDLTRGEIAGSGFGCT